MGAKKVKKQPKFSINKLPQKPEGLSNANEKREACQHCGLYKRSGAPFGTPEIDDEWSGKLLFITDPLSEDATRIIRRAYERAGYAGDDVAYVAPLRCGGKSKPTMAQIRACRPFLLKILTVLQPKRVLGLGPTALRALRNTSDANVTKARGKLIKL